MKSQMFQRVIDLGTEQNIRVVLKNGICYFGTVTQIDVNYKSFLIEDHDQRTWIKSNSVACISYAQSENGTDT